MHTDFERIPARLRNEIPGWLQEHRVTHYITLTTHDQSLSIDRMRNRLRQWDAHLNHALIGRNWQKRRDQRIWCFCFLESPDANPHWHILLRLDETPVAGRVPDTQLLEHHTRRIWAELSPAGTVDVQEIFGKTDLKLTNYVAKQLRSMAQCSSFVPPDEFQ
jgi:ABC-type cobalamin transport system ATPase subunit